MSAPRVVRLDGSIHAVAELAEALEAALDGGPAVFPTGPGAIAAPPDSGRRAAVLIATSGSSGRPKLVVLSAAALRASALATHARLGGPARWLLALPAEHVAGVQVVVRALLAGAPPTVQDLRGGFRPDGFAAATAQLGSGRRYTSMVPTQLARLLDADGPALDALRTFDAVLVGGAALDAGLHARALAAGVAVVTTYGMSETAGGCVYDGVPLEGVRVELDAEGRIRLGGPVLADGYLGEPELTATAFADGWFHTGDLGRWREGRLEVIGRADDLVITGGENVAPAAVERVLAAQPGVRAACVVGLPDAQWGQVVAAGVILDRPDDLVEPPGRGDARPLNATLAAQLRTAVRAELGRAGVPRVLLAMGEIPLLGVGKPDRSAVARILVETRNAQHHPHV